MMNVDNKANDIRLFTEDLKVRVKNKYENKISELNSNSFSPESELDYIFIYIAKLLEDIPLFKTIRISSSSIVTLLIELKQANLSLCPRVKQATVVLLLDIHSGSYCASLYPTYQGIRDIAVSKGIITNAIPSLVYANDHFLWRGAFMEPEHEYDPFSNERGELRGGICKATLPDGRLIVSAIKREDLERSYRMAQTKQSKQLWHERTQLMLLGKVIRYASNDWPNTKESLSNYA
jgi:hypothetical protein